MGGACLSRPETAAFFIRVVPKQLFQAFWTLINADDADLEHLYQRPVFNAEQVY